MLGLLLMSRSNTYVPAGSVTPGSATGLLNVRLLVSVSGGLACDVVLTTAAATTARMKIRNVFRFSMLLPPTVTNAWKRRMKHKDFWLAVCWLPRRGTC